MPDNAASQPAKPVMPYKNDYLSPAERQEREEIKARLRESVLRRKAALTIRAKLQYLQWKVTHKVQHLTFEELEVALTHVEFKSPPRSQPSASKSMLRQHPGYSKNVDTPGSISVNAQKAVVHSTRSAPNAALEGSNATQSLYASMLSRLPADLTPGQAASRALQSEHGRTIRSSPHSLVGSGVKSDGGVWGSEGLRQVEERSGQKRKMPPFDTSSFPPMKRARVADASSMSDLQAAEALASLSRGNRCDAAPTGLALVSTSHASPVEDTVALGQRALKRGPADPFRCYPPATRRSFGGP